MYNTEYLTTGDLDEVLEVLAERKDRARLVAGGTNVIPNIAKANQAVARGFSVTPKPSSIQVSPMKSSVASQMFRSAFGHLRLRPRPSFFGPQNRSPSAQSEIASQGQT